jgi:iron complex outermembrane receptor protein
MIIGDQDALQTRTNLEFQANTRIAPDVRMAWGAELRREAVQSALYFDADDTRQGVLGRVNANLEWRARPDLLLQGGAMLEHHYYTGVNVSPRLAVNYDLAPDSTLRFNVSQAYRTPTFLEQDGLYVYRSTAGLPVDIIGVTPNDLLPERIRSHEIGYVGRYRPWRLQLDAKLFYDKVDDYIATTPITLPVGAELVSGGNPGGARQVVNGGSLTLRGGDLQLNWQPAPAFRLSVQYARVFISTSPELDLVDDDVTDSAPRDSFSLLARHDLGQGWAASAGVYYSGSMIWLGDGDPTPAFTRVDVRLARSWNWQGHEVEAAVVGQNLGEDYSEFRPENRFSRRVYGSLSLAW